MRVSVKCKWETPVDVMKHNVDFDIVVVGGGIVGLASAYKIARKHPGISIAGLQ
jgi:ribulose 1,5-bisphosphate synthetase/thiazole synthase